MYLIAVKLIEILARAGFVAGLTYSLPLQAAGQFGLVVTLVGLFALGFGWERHIDLQRRIVSSDEPTFDAAIAAAVPFWGFNYALLLPAFLVCAALLAQLDALELALAAVVVISEHIGNQAYQMALVNRRYRTLVPMVAAKNLAALAIVLPSMLFAPSKLTLGFVLAVWAGVALLSGLAVAVSWWRIRHHPPKRGRLSLRADILPQHHASLTHFRIGVVAYLMLQYDRLAVGTFAGLAEAGVYFRHVLLIFFGYQLYTVASFNRITPAIFAAAKSQSVPALLARVRREYLVLVALAVAGAGAAVVIDLALGRLISTHYHLSYALAAVLLSGALLRIAADFGGLIVNARMREGTLARAQLTAFACGIVLLAGLTAAFGIMGAAIANIVTSAIYLLLVARAVRALPALAETAP